jgi:hypothetical protein
VEEVVTDIRERARAFLRSKPQQHRELVDILVDFALSEHVGCEELAVAANELSQVDIEALITALILSLGQLEYVTPTADPLDEGDPAVRWSRRSAEKRMLQMHSPLYHTTEEEDRTCCLCKLTTTIREALGRMGS